MELLNLIAEVVTILVSIMGFFAFILIINIILKAQAHNADYDTRKTIRLFKYLFLTMAILDSFLLLDKFYSVNGSIIVVFFVLKAILTIITVINYYMDIPKFSEAKISFKKHNETLKSVISDFENSTLSPEVKEAFIEKLRKYLTSE